MHPRQRCVWRFGNRVRLLCTLHGRVEVVERGRTAPRPMFLGAQLPQSPPHHAEDAARIAAGASTGMCDGAWTRWRLCC